MVGRLIEARGVRYDAVALLGLSEGIWPEPEHPDPLLDEALRASLGLEPRLQRGQEGVFYQALARADRFLPGRRRRGMGAVALLAGGGSPAVG